MKIYVFFGLAVMLGLNLLITAAVPPGNDLHWRESGHFLNDCIVQILLILAFTLMGFIAQRRSR